MRSMPSLCGSCKRGGWYFAFAAARRRFPPGQSHADAGAPASTGTTAPARAAVGDLRLLCHCNAGYCLHHRRAVARACVMGQQAQLPGPVWQIGLVALGLMPAIVAGILLLARGPIWPITTGHFKIESA